MEHLSLVRLQSHLPDCFNALIQQAIFPATYVATKQVTLGVLQCSTLKKVDKSLPQSLQKVEQSCTFCNGCATKEIARRVVVLVCLTLFTTRQVLCTLCGKLPCVTPSALAPRARTWCGAGVYDWREKQTRNCETQVGSAQFVRLSIKRHSAVLVVIRLSMVGGKKQEWSLTNAVGI